MRILIVEDDENKSHQLNRFVRDDFPESELRSTRSLQAGVRCIRSQRFDLILLAVLIHRHGSDSLAGVA